MEIHRLIPLKRRDGTITAYALVSDCDYVYLRQWIWRLHNGYAFRSRGQGRNGAFPMHREIAERAGMDTSETIDHINRVKLDNRRSNLRPATRLQQMWNRSKNRNNMSGTTGVSWHKRAKKWMAEISIRGKGHHLGSFDNLENAVDTRNKAVLERDPEFAVLSEALI